MKEKMQKILVYVKKHKKEILIGSIVTVVTGISASLITKKVVLSKYTKDPTRLIVECDNKQAIDTFKAYYNYRADEPVTGGLVSVDENKQGLVERVSNWVNNRSEDEVYQIIVEARPKSNTEG